MNVLLIEGDHAQAEEIIEIVEGLGCDVSRFEEGATAINFLQKNHVDLVILDWKLPGVSGLDVLQWVRAHLRARPGVLFLTGNMLEDHIVQALDSGADEYIAKPFRRAELAARVNALLRRVSIDTCKTEMLTLGHYTLDFNQRVVRLRDRPIDLTEKEFELVSILFQNLGRMISRDAIARLAWGRGYDGFSRTIDTHVSYIRRKLALCPENGIRLNAVYAHGYRLTMNEPEQKNSRRDYLEKAVL
jgi:two-component system, OmpR family, response regulator